MNDDVPRHIKYLQQPAFSALPVLYVPALQSVQVFDPAKLYFPASQSIQLVSTPGILLYVPAGQFSHWLLVETNNFDCGQAEKNRLYG